MEETISLKEIFEVLRKHLATIFVSMFLGLGLAGAVTFFVITPQYSSRAQLIVTLPQSEGTAGNVNDINYNLQMLNTYKDIIKEGDALALEVQKRLADDYDIKLEPKEIKAILEVTQSQNSQMFSISATSDRAINAEHIANTAAEVFQETVADVLTVDKTTIVSKATASSTPVSPNNKLNLVIGLVLGLMVGIGLAFLMQLFDRTVKDNKFVTDTLGFTILGTVPQMTQKEINATTQKMPKKEIKKLEKTETATRRSRSRV
ncbi:YveK family protein [Candidatus Enterococcus willemsii]|uniref:Capsular polysaccharide biosynthesis protein CpsC n=1 Tax=Candidatus Enterococcus willemsii TaxID=1857215 RepID=A0ABQ6YZJ8_9ENTE|nr:Wzz/FepE/Etk N-terminal domain-containing protein [Enterococcus sp. CU12B]KAF1303632.1 tyrosine protein kinase [Enterococcus sp. CU12B]